MDSLRLLGVDNDAAEESDQTLALRARDGQDAFGILYERYADRVQSYVFACIGTGADVEDVSSTVFLRAIARIETYRPERGTFAGWLFAIARNAVRDHLRQRARERPMVGIPEWLQEARPGPEEVSVHREQYDAMRQAYFRLREDQREALALRYLADLSFAEAASILGRSVPATKMLTKRGVDGLRRQLEGGWNDG